MQEVIFNKSIKSPQKKAELIQFAIRNSAKVFFDPKNGLRIECANMKSKKKINQKIEELLEATN